MFLNIASSCVNFSSSFQTPPASCNWDSEVTEAVSCPDGSGSTGNTYLTQTFGDVVWPVLRCAEEAAGPRQGSAG